jgi:hypothetical protein
MGRIPVLVNELMPVIIELVNAIAGYELNDCPKEYPPRTKQNEKNCSSCVERWRGIAAAIDTAAYVLAMGACTAISGAFGIFACVSIATTTLAYSLANLANTASDTLEKCKCKS